MDETGKDNVGFSLLTNENPLTVNNDDQEDEEAEEEQRRRQQELQSMMAYAFDDIGDEENSTINSSFEHSVSGHGHSAFTSGITRNDESSVHHSDINLEDQYRHADINSDQQMKILYQVQEREIKRLNAELSTLRENKDKELTQLKRKILLMENEHNGTAISLKQCQDLLVEKKRDIDEKLSEITVLKDQIDNLTLSKRNIEEESQMWKSKYSEIEQKMNLIDQGLYVPISERQIRNKYEQEIADLQHALEQSQKNLEKAIKAQSIAENETKDIKQTHEIFAMEKEEEIHNLYSQLETSKFQCHNLTDRIESLEKEYQNLTNILNNTTRETESLQISSSMKTIQAELKRSLEDQKLKREEIIKLENKLSQAKTNEMELKQKINDLENRLSKSVSEKDIVNNEKEKVSNEILGIKKELEETTSRLEYEKSRLLMLENNLQQIQIENNELKKKLEENKKCFKEEEIQTSIIEPKKSNSYEIVKINSELEMLKIQNEQLYKQLEETNKRKKEIELQSLKKIQELQSEMKPSTIDKKAHQIQELEENNQKLKNQLEELQKAYDLMKDDEQLYKNQFEKYEKLCLELQQNCAEQKSQLYEYHTKITELEGKLLLKEKRDDLLEDLQQKALMFEQYIKTKSDTVQNKSVNTSLDSAHNLDVEQMLKATQQKLIEVSNENAKLKEKILFDRTALNELTDVWNNEITRLNTLVTELKSEVDNKNALLERHQKTVTEEMSQMSLLIQKLTEALQSKDKTIKDIQDKTRQHQEVAKGIQKNYQQKESLLLTQFEQNMEDMKNKFLREEENAKSAVENLQQRCVNGLEELYNKIDKQMKYNNEKYDVETKIIEKYYDLIIQQAKTMKSNKKR